MIIRLIFALIAITTGLRGEPFFKDAPRTENFGLITIPKAGTHLLMKCFELLQTRTNLRMSVPLGRSELNNFVYSEEASALIDAKMDSLAEDSTRYLVGHSHLTCPMIRFLDRHPDFPVVVGIRDLRDTLVSLVNFSWNRIETAIGPSTFEEKLTFLLTTKDGGPYKNVVIFKQHAKEILNLFKHPNALVVRFEDLVGAQGGGDNVLQKEVIRKIAEHIGVEVSETRISEIQSILFGNAGIPSNTFRTGKKEAWRASFTPAQIEIFNKRYGALQQALGYSID